jgi:uncharacterized protein DUF5658
MHDPPDSGCPLPLLVNIGLQLLDGVATYQGLRWGGHELNPILRAAIAQRGVVSALLGWKLLACGLLVFLRMVNRPVLAVKALILTTLAYICFSLVPGLWLVVSHA